MAVSFTTAQLFLAVPPSGVLSTTVLELWSTMALAVSPSEG